MNHPPDPAALILAAGGIVEKLTPQGPLIALIYRERYGGEWSLPKGKQEPHESLQETALREVEEETGCRVRFTGFAGCTHYYHGDLPKVVFYWRMTPEKEGPFLPSKEVCKLQWVAPSEAIALAAHEDERHLLRRIFAEPATP